MADVSKPNPAPTGGKGKKKKKPKTVMTLDQFLAETDGSSAPKAPNWATATEGIDDDPDAQFKFDRSKLPTAPKAAMGLSQVDLSMIPPNGPFSAYVGNLAYEVSDADLEFFFKDLEIEKIRMITDGGRPRGYAYVDFMTKESLVEALSYSDKEYMGRNVRVDLASQKDQDSRSGGFGSRSRSDEPDRTEGNWRSGPRDTPSGGDRGGGGFERRDNRDRGYGFGGGRDSEERGGDRGGTWERGGASERSSFGGDRGGDRGGTWERGGGRDRDRGGDRDRGFGGDRGGDRGGTWERGLNQDRDRGFGGDRDRGFGGNRDRGYGGDRDRGFGGDRDRGFGGDRDRGFGGDRDRGFGGDRDRGYGGDRDRGYGGDRDRGFDRDRGGDREQDAAPAERPKLKLQPRSKPAENKEESSSARSSIFGAAKPVDTSSREKEIESSLHKKPEAPPASAPKASIFGAAKPVDTYAREKEIEAKIHADEPARTPKDSDNVEAPVSRQNSSTSTHSASDEPHRSPTAKEAPKIIPAPLPKENPWGKKVHTSDASNNASQVAQPSAPAAKRVTPEKDAPHHARSDAPNSNQESNSHKPAWGRGPRSEEDSRRYGDNRGDPGRGRDAPKAKPVKEKQLPKHYDEMPKYEENKGADFTVKNKFAFLPEDDDGDNLSEERNES